MKNLKRDLGAVHRDLKDLVKKTDSLMKAVCLNSNHHYLVVYLFLNFVIPNYTTPISSKYTLSILIAISSNINPNNLPKIVHNISAPNS